MELVKKTETEGKECSVCGVHKPLEEYHKRFDGNSKDGYQGICKPCNIENQRDSRYRRVYDINIEQYNQMFADQEGSCACCGKHQSEFKKRLSVDHDHNLPKGHPNRVRGLLCVNCNTGIGKLGDNMEGLEQAMRYLNDYS